MTVPDANTVVAWGTAIATLIIVIRQQVNAMAGKQRSESMQTTMEVTKQKVETIHSTTTNGQIEVLKSRAVALRELADLRKLPADQLAAVKAELDLATYINNTKGAA